MPTLLTYRTPTGLNLGFHYDHGRIERVTVRSPLDPAKETVHVTASRSRGSVVTFTHRDKAKAFLERLGLEGSTPIHTIEGSRLSYLYASDLLDAVGPTGTADRPQGPTPAPEEPAPAPKGPSLPATWQQAYTVVPEQDDAGRWAFHVYYTGTAGRDNVRLTHTGYDRASMAERVAEMRFKLRLDEPDSASRRYLATHFNDTLKKLEG